MKSSLILILFFFTFSSEFSDKIGNHNLVDEVPNEQNLQNSYFAKVYYNSRPWEVVGTARSLLHEFDCSISRWRKEKPMIYCEISNDIELILYESENYQGEYRVLNSSSRDIKHFPEKFRLPGSIEVLYKGNRSCISNVNSSRNSSSNYQSRSRNNNSSYSRGTNSKDAIDYIYVQTHMSEPFDPMNYRTYIYNTHKSKAINVRYKVKGRYGESKNTIKVYPNEKEEVSAYTITNETSTTILSASFVN